MTNREKVDKILTLQTGKTGIHLDMVKKELSDAGVVIKVERRDTLFALLQKHRPLNTRMTKDELEELANSLAGYVAVEPLIEERNAVKEGQVEESNSAEH